MQPLTVPTPPLTDASEAEIIDLERALDSEWLEVDGLGGYASSTILLCPTRRYHGLLVGCPPGNDRRHVFLSRFEETLVVGGDRFEFSMAKYPGSFAPDGHEYFEEFMLAPFPTARYRCGDVGIRREVLLVRGKKVVLCRYTATGGAGDIELELRPFLPFREADDLTFENGDVDASHRQTRLGVALQPYPTLPPIAFSVEGCDSSYEGESHWYRDLEYAADARRGYPSREDQFTPGCFRLRLQRDVPVVVATALETPVDEPLALWAQESGAREARCVVEVLECGENDALSARLSLAADAFLYTASDGRRGVLAGFPWFGEWGRDAFIALPGLTLARERYQECADVLSGSLPYLRDGLLPNVYGQARADSHYGSVDASLWFARAVRLYERATGDEERVLEEYLPALREIAECYHGGTAMNIHADEAGLIEAGTPVSNPTWMDARTPDGAVTPRDGCAVEINALWYALLWHLEHLLDRAGDQKSRKSWMARRRLVRRSFLERFWLEEGYLADRWKEGDADKSVRPNMVIAAALEKSPLVREQRAAVVERAEVELLTPRGLRTLSPRHAEYRPRYAGGPEERDSAYHQGTVWPWLLGFFCEASLRANGTRRAERDRLCSLWQAFAPELDRHGLDHVSEVFDGDPPHDPGGTIAQAWNTAEYLRVRAMLANGRP